MKKTIGFILSLVLVVSSFAGCSQEAKQMVDNMKQVDKYEFLERHTVSEYEIELNKIIKIVEQITGINSLYMMESDDSAVAETKKIVNKFKELLEKNPTLIVKVTESDYIEGQPSVNNSLESVIKIEIDFLGVKKTISGKFLSDGKNVFIEKKLFAEMRTCILEYVEVVKPLKEEYKNAFKEGFPIHEQEYYYLPIDNEVIKNYTKLYHVSLDNSAANEAELEKMVESLELDKHITEKNGDYTIKLPLKVITDSIALFVEKQAKADGIDLEKNYQNLNEQEKLKRSIFESELMQFKTLSAQANGLFNGSDIVYTNSYKNNELKEKSEIKLVYLGDTLANFKMNSSIKEVAKKTITVPALKDCYNLASELEKNSLFVNSTMPTNIESSELKLESEKKVYFNQQEALLDGANVDILAFNVNDNNFVMLRDLANVLKNTDKKFVVSFDKDTKTILMETNKAYQDTQAIGDIKVEPITISANTYPIYIDGNVVNLEAYNINGNTYFKLRDLGTALNFVVDYDATNNIVIIKTK